MSDAMDSYRAVQLSGKGGLDRLQEVELPVIEPGPGELRVRVRATGVGFTDVLMRRGYYPYRPAFPFVPGYEVVGTVDAIGPGVEGFAVGDRVAALTVHGGYAELMVRAASEFVPVPDAVSDVDAAAAILNYVTAYQMIHRTAACAPGSSALVTGASGGVGLALLELLRDAEVEAIGAASVQHHGLVRERGAVPVDGRRVDVAAQVRALRPAGVDAAFDGIGGAVLSQCVSATRRGGTVIAYGFTGVMTSTVGSLRGIASVLLGAPLRGRRGRFYGITQLYRRDPQPFREDLPKVFDAIARGRIAPRIARRMGLLEGRAAQALLEQGGVGGKIVLVA
ncbi:MAG: zinc-binding dehydrogenase [Nannocystaceae bacterium]|nr:zinc-binding dehydrogenase [Nannocystaceae bacterium]